MERLKALIATGGNDILIGTAHNDFIDGGAGDDTLTGKHGADTFVSRLGGGDDKITDFNAQAGDRMLVDWYGSYSDISTLEQLTDGLTITTITGGQIHISISDTDLNGKLDTVISNDFGDSITVWTTPTCGAGP